MGSRLGALKAQRRAMTSVFCTASGRSANSSAISAADLNLYSGLKRLRLSCATCEPVAMQTSASCDLVQVGGQEEDVVGGDEGDIVLVGEVDEPRLDQGLDILAVPHQLDIEPVAEGRVQVQEQPLGQHGVATAQG